MTSQSSLAFILRFSRAYPRRTAFVLAGQFVAGLLEGVGVASLVPVLGLLGDVKGARIDGLNEAVRDTLAIVGLSPTLGVLLTIMVLAVTGKAVVTLAAMQQAGYTSAQVAHELRLDLIRALLKARWRHFTGLPVGSSANAIATEADRAAGAYLNFCKTVTYGVQIFIYAALALAVSWQVTLAALIAGGAMAVALNGLVRYVREAGKMQTQTMKSLIGRLTDALSGVKAIKAMGREDHFTDLLRNETKGLRLSQRRQVFGRELLNQIYEPITVAVMAGGLFFAVTVLHMTLMPLLVLAFLFYRMVSKVAVTQKSWQAMVVLESAYWSLMEATEAALGEAEPPGGAGVPTLEKGIALNDVTFSHGEQPLFERLSMEFPARKLTAVIGPSGSGKTTLFDLIAGLNTPQQGEVLVDGVSLADIDRRGWRHMIGYVPQETYLFNDTILNNVTLGQKDLSREDAQEALRAAGAWEFIAALTEGIDTSVGERGLRFSGGQRQRIAIARALAGRPQLLLLDEATSALDTATEREILATVRALADKVTVIAISHNEAVLDVADHVYQIRGGRIVETMETRKAIGV